MFSSKFLAVVLFLIALLAGGAYGAYAFVLNPAIALPEAVSNIASSSSIHGELHLLLDSSDPQLDGIGLDITSNTDRSVPTSFNSQLIIDAQSVQGGIGADVRLVNGVLYGELTHVPSTYTSILADMTNHWYSVSYSTLQSVASTRGVSVHYAGSVQSFVDMYDRLLTSGILGMPSFMGFGFVSGHPVRLYSIQVNKDVLAQAISQWTTAVSIPEADVQELEFSPMTISTDLISGSFRDVRGSISLPTKLIDSTQLGTTTLRYDLLYSGTKSVSTIPTPSDAKSMDPYIAHALKAVSQFSIQSSIH